MVWSALIGAGASLLGQHLAGKQSARNVAAANKEAVKIAREDRWFQNKWNIRNERFASSTRAANLHHKIKYAAADAKRAGLHPLFALGGGVSGSNASPTFNAGGSVYNPVPETGSGLGEGIAAAGRAVQSYMESREGQAQQGRLLDAQIRAQNASAARDEAQALATASAAKRAEQRALQGPRPGIPLGAQAGTPLHKRPLESSPRRSEPRNIEVVGPNGRRTIMNPDLGMDELGQIEFAFSPMMDWASALYDDAFNRKWYRPKKGLKNARNIYHYWKEFYKRAK